MKNLSKLLLVCVLLSLVGLACKNSPLAGLTKQYTCEIAGEAEPKTSDDYVSRAAKHYEMNNYADDERGCAFQACAEAVRLDAKNPAALSCRGNLYRSRGEFDLALADLNEAIRLAPDNSFYYQLRSRIYEDKDMNDKALADITKAIELSETTGGTVHYDFDTRGDIYMKTGDYENAVKDYTEAINLKPDYQYYYSDRAEAYRKLGKNDLAEADDAKAKELEQLEKAADLPENPPVVPNSSTKDSKAISGGVLNGKATNLPTPVYPQAAKAVKASGAVNVQIMVDETGKVVSASAVSGHPLLKASAEQAARQAKFKPTLLSGKPVKVSGVLIYKFVAE